MELLAYAGTLDLTPGVTFQKVNTLHWIIDYTYAGTATDPNDWSDLAFNVDGSRNLSLDAGPAGVLNQSGLLEVTWENDYLSFSLGSETSFVVQGYRVDITPLAVARQGGTNFSGGNPWTQPDRDMMAQFEITAVPEPGTMILLGAGLIGLAGLGISKRRHQ